MTYKIGIIGLGVVGQRTLANLSTHPGFAVTRAWDPDPARREEVAADHGEVAIGAGPDQVIAARDVDAVYIASPPAHHRDHVLAAIEAGKHIFCEKPLGIDVAQSRDLVERVEGSGLRAAVNFVYGAAPGGAALQERLRAGAPGEVLGVDVRLHFALWPRPWQARATWLEKRAQGGFVREVLSHFVFLVQRLFGNATIAGTSVAYPDGPGGVLAESAIAARLDCGGVPVTVAGSVGGQGPDQIECTIWGAAASYRITDWYRLWRSRGGDWVEQLTDVADARSAAYSAQTDALCALLDGRPQTMPTFREALAVQETIEALLAVEG